MYSVSANYRQAAFADARKNYFLVTYLLTGDELTNDDIISLELLTSECSDNDIGIGLTPSATLKLTFRMPDPPLQLVGAWIRLEHSFDGSEWCPLGRFKIADYQASDFDKTVTVTAYDMMAYLSEPYVPTIAFPASLYGIVLDIGTQYGFSTNPYSYPLGSYPLPDGATCREMLGYIAGMMGRNAVFNYDGNLEFRWFSQLEELYGDVNFDGVVDSLDADIVQNQLMDSTPDKLKSSIVGQMYVGTAIVGVFYDYRAFLADVNGDGIVDQDDLDEIQAYVNGTPWPDTKVGTLAQYTENVDDANYYLHGVSKYAESLYTVTYLVSGTEDIPITSGSGSRGITFTNPWMTQLRLDAIKADVLGLSGFSYLPCKVRYRGCPAWEVGDIIRVLDEDGNAYNVPLMSHRLIGGNGLQAEMEAKGSSEDKTVALKGAPTIQNILQEMTSLETMSETITGAKGGYYRLLTDPNDNDRPYGIEIGSDQAFTKSWKFTYGGLGFFDNGVMPQGAVAFDMDGNLNANYITTGTLNAGRIGAGTISAKVYAGDFNLTGGSVNIATDTDTDDRIVLSHGDYSVRMSPSEFALNYQLAPKVIMSASALISLLVQGDASVSGDLTANGLAVYANETVGGNSTVAGTMSANSVSSTTDSNFGGCLYANQIALASPVNASQDPVYRSTTLPYRLGVSGSKREWKHDIKDLSSDLYDIERLYDLPVRQFKWNEDIEGVEDPDAWVIGLIAEEVEDYFPLGAIYRDGICSSWSERSFVPALLALIQKQHEEIDELKARLDALEGKE